jgi:uncharacterized protein with PCYCGC motif
MKAMGRKSSAKAQTQSAAPPPKEPQKSRAPLIAVAVGAIALVGLIAYGRSGSDAQSAAPAQAAPVQTLPEPENAKFGPHQQSNLPPLPFGLATPVRPVSEVAEAYTFAAEHPEILGYLPCYCGCERQGHRGNDDCFVTRRAPNGDVLEWEPHGMT